MKKRTDIDFSKHELIIIDNEHIKIHHLQKPNTRQDNIKFINAGGVLSVTGDYGNWIFCREFHPAPDTFVSDYYWTEKLKNSSSQEHEEFDEQATIKELIRYADGGYAEEGHEGEELSKMIEYANECLGNLDDGEEEYRRFAFENLPPFVDQESMIYIKDTKYWLKAVFDGFDEICTRLKNKTV